MAVLEWFGKVTVSQRRVEQPDGKPDKDIAQCISPEFNTPFEGEKHPDARLKFAKAMVEYIYHRWYDSKTIDLDTTGIKEDRHTYGTKIMYTEGTKKIRIRIRYDDQYGELAPQPAYIDYWMYYDIPSFELYKIYRRRANNYHHRLVDHGSRFCM